VIKKIESYRVTHNGVIPVTPYRGAEASASKSPRVGRVTSLRI